MCYHLHPGPFIRLHCQEMQLCILRVLAYNQYEYVSFENLFNSFTIFFFFPLQLSYKMVYFVPPGFLCYFHLWVTIKGSTGTLNEARSAICFSSPSKESD